MDNIITLIIASVAGVAVGFLIAKFFERNNASQLIKSAKKMPHQ